MLVNVTARLNDAQDARDITNILEQLVREEMLSHEQYIPKTGRLESTVIKETNIGQYLPKTKMLPSLLEELVNTGK